MKKTLTKDYINIFDVCGTLYSVNTTFEFIVFYHKNKKNLLYWFYSKIAISKFGKLLAIIFKFSTRKQLLKSLKGVSREELYRISEIFYDEILLNNKNSNIFKLFEELDNKVLLSASIAPVIQVIADKLNCTYYSSQLKYNNNICMGILDFDLKGKKASCVNSNVIYVITDNLDDTDIIKLAKESFLVAPNIKRMKKWEELQNTKLKNTNTQIINTKGS